MGKIKREELFKAVMEEVMKVSEITGMTLSSVEVDGMKVTFKNKESIKLEVPQKENPEWRSTILKD